MSNCDNSFLDNRNMIWNSEEFSKMDIAIKDNFFEEKQHTSIMNDMLNASYDPPPTGNVKGNQGCYWFGHVLPQECEVQNLIKGLIKKHFNFKIKDFVVPTFYTMVGATDKGRPHRDITMKGQKGAPTHQCIIYVKGDEKMNNGTGFYKMINDEAFLVDHIGFKQNRAIFFNSRFYHCPTHYAGDSSWRYAISNFFNEEL